MFVGDQLGPIQKGGPALPILGNSLLTPTLFDVWGMTKFDKVTHLGKHIFRVDGMPLQPKGTSLPPNIWSEILGTLTYVYAQPPS